MKQEYKAEKQPIKELEEMRQRITELGASETERKRTEEEIKTLVRQQEVVAELGQHALSSTDLPELIEDAVAFVAQTLGVEYCKILELLPDGKDLLLRVGVGWKEGYVGHATVGAGTDSQAGYTLLSKEPVIVEDLRTEKRFSGSPLLHDHGVVSGMSTIIHGKDRPFGVLGAHTTRRQTFSGDDIHFLQSVANILAEAIEHERAEVNLSKRNKDLEILNTITQAAHKSHDLEEIYNVALDSVASMENVDMTMIYLVDWDTKEAILQASRNVSEDYIDRAGRIPYPKGLTWRVINTGEVVNIKDIQKDPVVGPAGRDLGHHGVLGIPIALGEKVIGVIWFLSYKERQFDKQEEDLLTSIGYQVAIAVAKAKHTEDLNRRNEDLEIINAITQAVHQSLDLKEVFRIALDKVIELGNIDIACIYLVDEATNEAVVQDHRNFPDDFLRRASRIPYPKGATWKVIKTGKALNVKNAQDDPDVGPAGRDLGFRSMLGIPIRLEDKTIGVIWLLGFKERAFTKPEITLLTSIGNQTSIAIAKANLYRELSKKNRYEEIISIVTRSVHQSIKLQDVLENAVESMSVNIHGAENVFISLIEGEYAVLKAHRGYPDWFVERVRRIPYPKGTTWKTIIEGKPRYVADVDQDTVIGPAGREVGTKSYLSMPIHFEGKTVGVININSLQKNAFDEEELKLLEIVANQIEVAINNAKQADAIRISEKALSENIDKLSKSIRYEKVISLVTKSVHKSINITDVLENAVESIYLNVYGTDNISIYFVEGNDAVMKAYRGYPDWFIKRVGRIPYPKGFTWKTIIEGKPRYVADVDMDDIIGPAGREVGTKSYLSMPICLEDNVVGVININSLREHAFSKQELELLEIVAHQIEVAISNAKKAEVLRESEERYRTLFDQSPVGVYIFDKDYRIIHSNKRFLEIMNSSYDEILGFNLRDLGDDCILSLIEKALQGESGAYEGNCETINKSAKLWVSVRFSPLRNSDGTVFGGMAVVEDITERKHHEEQIRHMAMHDSLTDLPNRRALQETLDRLMKRPKFKNTHALVVMDLDSFKIVNDTLGYLEGDQLLKDLADILRNRMRPNDLLARVGGDEFTMVLKDVTPERAKQIAERFNKAINDYSFYLNGYSFQIGMSIGITMIDSKSDPQMIMAMAYSALSKAKYEGKNRIIVYQHEDKKDFDFDKATQWVFRIKDALREDRFLLHFQPVIQLDNGEIEYIESFVRMIDNRKKIIFPGAFIPAAEQFGLMSEIDKWVVEEVVRILNENRKHRLFVNLSGSSLKDTSLLGFIEQLIKDNKGISNKLGFEITEFTRITDLEHVRNWMVRLKDLGCKFALDDFGIGYSSFTYLLALPLDYVKIEGSFVRNLNTDPTSSEIVQSVIRVSHSLGKEVIAECVEDESIVKFLRKHKVKFGQGNLWKMADKHIN